MSGLELQITEATRYRWLQQHGSEKNARLKKLVAEKELAIDIPNEMARGKF